jgi:hypothetical protein
MRFVERWIIALIKFIFMGTFIDLMNRYCKFAIKRNATPKFKLKPKIAARANLILKGSYMLRYRSVRSSFTALQLVDCIRTSWTRAKVAALYFWALALNARHCSPLSFGIVSSPHQVFGWNTHDPPWISQRRTVELHLHFPKVSNPE